MSIQQLNSWEWYTHSSHHKIFVVDMGEQIQYAFIILMVLAFGIIKLSITLNYRRIFVAARGTLFDWTTIVVIVIVVLWTIACLFSFIFPCGTHISANWGSIMDFATYCGASTNVNNAFVVSDLLTDIMIWCLPLPVVRLRSTEFLATDRMAKDYRFGTYK